MKNEAIGLMQKIAISLIPLAVYSAFADSLLNSIINGKLNFVMDIDILVIMAILLVFLLTFIFKYGAMLQQESDETL
ncbi:MAG: hypothetical protein IJ024_02640 [Lachnospiraceae bacterium]|nr:hypothetical protein [Lachnospiraceae bacterium]